MILLKIDIESELYSVSHTSQKVSITHIDTYIKQL